MKLLKLVEIDTFISPLTKIGEGDEAVTVRRGEVVAFDDGDADSAMTGTRVDREGKELTYFSDVSDTHEGAIAHDFTARRRAGGRPMKNSEQFRNGPAAEPRSPLRVAPEADEDSAATVSRVSKPAAKTTAAKPAAKTGARVSRQSK